MMIRNAVVICNTVVIVLNAAMNDSMHVDNTYTYHSTHINYT